MARNLKRYGYVPNQRHNLTVLTIQHRRRQGLTHPQRAPRTPEQQRAAMEPMTPAERGNAYARQNHAYRATPRQRRRIIHKAGPR